MKQQTRSKDIEITASSAAAFLRCPEYYKLGYIELLKKPEEAGYFWFGKVFHDALACMYRKQDVDKFFIDIGLAISKNCRDESFADIYDRQLTMIIDIEKIYNRYAKFYRTDITNWKILEIETAIESELFGYKIKGKPDMIVEENGQKWIVEHKTASSINHSYLRKITIDFQSIFYLLLVPDATGIIYNVVSKTPQPAVEPLKNGELSKDIRKRYNHLEYITKVHELGLDIKEYKEHIDYLKSKQGDFFYRQKVVYNAEQIERFKQDLYGIFDEIKLLENNPDASYRNICSCYTFNSECKFYPICSAPYPEAAKDMFVKKEKKHEEY